MSIRTRRNLETPCFTRPDNRRNRDNPHTPTVFGLALLALLALPVAAQAAPMYHFRQLGLVGPDYQSSRSGRWSHAQFLNESGQVAGWTQRYDADDAVSKDTWFHDGSRTMRIGFIGQGYETSRGYRDSTVVALNDLGQVAGYSERYDEADNYNGRDAWLFDGSETRLGLRGSGYESDSGYRSSTVELLNRNGVAAGTSERHTAAGEMLGIDAWRYDGVATVRLGFTGPDYESPDGYRESQVRFLADNGQVAGHSTRMQAAWGQDAWLSDGTTTVRLGLTGPGYERSNGDRNSRVEFLNNTGQAAGYTEAYGATDDYQGHRAWLYDGLTTIELGLSGADHESATGIRISGARGLNEAGQVIGLSIRLDAQGIFTGEDAWLWDGAALRQLGFTGAGYESSAGNRVSYAQALNASGQVAGGSFRYSPESRYDSQAWGADAWFFDGAATLQIGLAGPGHESQDGYRRSGISFINDAGQIAGYSTRLSDGAYRGQDLGQDAWIYDALSGQTHTLHFSMSPAFGDAFSEVTYLDQRGNALGYFVDYGGTPVSALTRRAFYFSLADASAYVLEDLIIEDISRIHWSELADAIQSNGPGQIIGGGWVTGSNWGRGAYLLTPARVPEPTTAWLLGGALLLLYGLRGRRDRQGSARAAAGRPLRSS